MDQGDAAQLKGRILVYSIAGCRHCVRAKETLRSRGLPFTDVPLDSYASSVRTDLQRRTGVFTVPQIFFNHVFVGGDEQLHKLVEDEQRWQSLVQWVRGEAPSDSAPSPPSPSLRAHEPTDLGGVVCEEDELVRLVRLIKTADLIKDNRAGLRVHKKSFTGRHLVDWLTQHHRLDYYAAMKVGQQLLDENFCKPVDSDAKLKFNPDTLYRLLEDSGQRAVNASGASDCAQRPAAQLGEQLRRTLLHLYAKHLSDDATSVDYAGLRAHPLFPQYEQLARQLQRADVSRLDRAALLAFFINVYNALVIHGTVLKGKPTNLWQRYKFFNSVRYVIAGHSYSLQDVENGVLRGNRRGLGALSLQFGTGDPRLCMSIEGGEPLIHFALNCGAKSCPPIKTFTAQDVHSELREAAKAFMEMDDNVAVHLDKWTVKLSKIFKWYEKDFGEDKIEVLKFIHSHMAPSAKRDALRKCIDYGCTVAYFPYDWGSNDLQSRTKKSAPKV